MPKRVSRAQGAARQRNGRLGKVDVCQVGTYLAYANVAANLWTLVDGELFLPEAWLTPAYADQRKACGVPAERVFQRKTDLGVQMIDRAQAKGLPFERVACDAFYGRDRQFRADLQAKNVLYAADIPADTPVYRREPRVGVPKKRHRRGRTPTRWKVLSRQKAQPVSRLARSKHTDLETPASPAHRTRLAGSRLCGRACLDDHRRPVKCVPNGWSFAGKVNGKCSYTLLNDPPDTSAGDADRRQLPTLFHRTGL